MITEEIKKYLKENEHYIKDENFTELYRNCSMFQEPQLTRLFLECDVNPLKYMTEVPWNFAYEMTDLVEADIPDNIIAINSSAFYGCKFLNEVYISKNCTSIGAYAFENCEKLEDIAVPDKIMRISDCVFRACKNLKDIIIGGELVYIGEGVFYGCTKLKSITFNGSIKDWGIATLNTPKWSLGSSIKKVICTDGEVKV